MSALVGACSDSTEFPNHFADAVDAAVVETLPPTIDAAPKISCSNYTRDGDETDVDCGGSICPPCANGKACLAPTDCASRVCTEAKCSNDVGCSDGTREAFGSIAAFPNIAGCSGGFAIAGIVSTTSPACARASGNSSANPTGAGCNVADLCQPGWHVCLTPADVAAKSGGTGCAGAAVAVASSFFAIRGSGPGGAMCGAGTNDLFGCGDVGVAPDPTCAPLDRFSNDLCAALPATWSCPVPTDEANAVTKNASDGGGVLCCRD